MLQNVLRLRVRCTCGSGYRDAKVVGRGDFAWRETADGGWFIQRCW